MKDQSNKPHRAIYTCIATLLLALLFAQAMTSIPRQSITFDEDLHISTGYGVVRTGDLRLVEDHPPLIGLLMSWPLLLSPNTPDPWDVPAWEQGDRRLFVRNEIWWDLPIDTWSIPPRIPIAWLAMLMGAVLFRWAAEWFGPRAGIVALAFFIFDPNILAHGTLATLDLGVACFIFIAMYGVQRLLHRPTWTNLVTGGVLLGLALGAKVSAVIVLPVGVGLIVLWGLVKGWRGKLISRTFVYLGVALLTLWAIHLFDFGPPPGFCFSLPAPTYWNSFLRVGRHVARGNPAFLLGETYIGGRWYYFPIVFALKTPLPTILLAGAALIMTLLTVCKNPRHRWRALIMAALPASYFLMSMANQINLGYRHILPILPFLYLFIAHAARIANCELRIANHASRITLYALLLWQIIGTLCVWPFHITFFNEIAGGPRNGYRYLADSNVDWGQGSKALRDYLEERSWPDVQWSGFTFFIQPELYGVRATPLPPLSGAPPVFPTRFNPDPGTYIISASTLRGLQLVADSEMYNWFWHREPDDVIANAMLVYHVPEQIPKPTWLAQCNVPVTPLPSDAIIEGFGRRDLRQTYFDCTQGWLIPDGGQSPGWYALAYETSKKDDEFIRAHLELAHTSFEQTRKSALPPFAIYEATSLPVSPDHPSTTPKVGDLTFLGHTVLDPPANGRVEQPLQVWTYWQVRALPERPLSLMLHIIGPGGAPVVVGDGLGVPVESWQVDDIIVQRHRLPLPPDAPAGDYTVYTGAYWLDTMERWPVVQAGQVTGDQFELAPIRVAAP